MTANKRLVVVAQELMMPVAEVVAVCRAAAGELEIVSVADVIALGTRLPHRPLTRAGPAPVAVARPITVGHRGLRFWRVARP